MAHPLPRFSRLAIAGSLLVRWSVLSAAGFAGGGYLGGWVVAALDHRTALLVSFATMALAVAIAQWWVLRAHLPRALALGWLLATVVGGTLGGYGSSWLAWKLVFGLPGLDYIPTYGFLRGFTLGAVQGVVLRRSGAPARWWSLQSGGAWCAGMVLGAHWLHPVPGVTAAIAGGTYGTLSGIGLLCSLAGRSPRSSSPQ